MSILSGKRTPLGSLRGLAGKYVRKKAREIRSDYLAAVILHLINHRRLSLLVGQHTFSERIMLRNAWPDPQYSRYADKYEVRAIVENAIGPQFLIPLYEVAESAEAIDFASLPTTFVMKATHGSSWVKLVMDKDAEDPEALKALAASWLCENYYRTFREKHYNAIKPRIIFEKLLLQDNGQPVDDYKIHCFRKNGKLTQIVQVNSDRFRNHRLNLFSSDWTPLDIRLVHEPAPAESIRKPGQLDEMLRLADRLSAGINYVRVDLYVSSGQVFFGELTFTPGAGLMRLHPREVERQWADLFDKDVHPRFGIEAMTAPALPRAEAGADRPL